MKYPFQQVDVFSAQACLGNPVAVFLESDGLSGDDMQMIARWTNLSETTFVSRSGKADYSVRIFTPSIELPFAGHPTLGTAYALKKAGKISGDNIVQECAFGLVNISFEKDKVFFELPHFSQQKLERDADISAAMGTSAKNGRLITTGPVWLVAELAQGQDISGLAVNAERFFALMQSLNATGVTVYSIDENSVVNVRAFFEANGTVTEDPVCGSGNAAVGVHIMKTDKMKIVGERYTARQGRALLRDGHVSVILGDKIKVGGSCTTVFEGHAHIGN